MTATNYEERDRVARAEVVVRYVGGAHVDPATGSVNGSAFERSRKDVDGVSLTRRGILSRLEDDDRQAIRQIMASRLNLGKTAIFVELGVSAILDTLAEFQQNIFVCEDPLPAEGSELANPAHALLVGFPFAGEMVGSLKSEVAGDKLKRVISGRFSAVLPPPPADTQPA